MCEHVNTVKTSINMLQTQDSDETQANALRLIRG
jgi:hypothetical protein